MTCSERFARRFLAFPNDAFFPTLQHHIFMKTVFSLALLLFVGPVSSSAAEKLKALIVDGQNNHAVWPKSSIMMKQYLEETGLFTVDIQRTRYTWQGEREKNYLALANVGPTENLPEPKPDPEFAPKFTDYDVVISNFGWRAAEWPEKARKAFEEYIENGGGFVSVHAADNSFPNWKAYNRMIALGGWGNRDEKDGPYVYYNDAGKLVRDETPGPGGAHGQQHEIPITIRVPDHPITHGLPRHWLTGMDECYGKLRGPAENMTILATGEDQTLPKHKGRHEPMLMTIQFGQGRVFHTTLGHDTPALENVGFITTFQRGTEWAATGKVTTPVPDDFPTARKASSRKFEFKK